MLLKKFKILLYFIIGFVISLSFSLLFHGETLAQNREIIKIYNTRSGVSTRYIGAVEGSVRFDVADFKDTGINAYRIYGGMSRWEAEDDDGKYGWPSIAEIKANPNIINWKWWDNIMTSPPFGSDYWWSDNPENIWQGNARTIFSTLKQTGIKPILTIRNVDNTWNPAWALQLNPPRTQEDWNEWWEHIFATVYWLNVRNDYQVDEFEIHNEPDNRLQGWGGNEADYWELVKVAKDAIDYVYKIYLPDRTYHIHAPKTTGGSIWPLNAFQKIPNYFDTVNVHTYDEDISPYIQKVRSWMNANNYANSDLWLGEWGTYQNQYNSIPFALNLIKNMIRASQSGNNYVYGSLIFALYDWGKKGEFKGLMNFQGQKQASYYAFRMGIRALQGGRPTFSTLISNPNLMAIATKDNTNNLYLLIVNSKNQSFTPNIDISAFMQVGNGTIWHFNSSIKDEIVSQINVNTGKFDLNIPNNTAVLIKLQNK